MAGMTQREAELYGNSGVSPEGMSDVATLGARGILLRAERYRELRQQEALQRAAVSWSLVDDILGGGSEAMARQ